jgi:transcriptional regulator with XRE-family HTH domain
MDALRFGRQFRALRIRLERRQRDVSASAGLSRSLIASIDRGEIEGVTVGALVRAARALGADVDIRLRWRGEQLDRLLDEAHAAIVEATVVLLRRHGWIVEVEVSFAIWGERGSIDVLAFHPEFGALLIIEVKASVPDSQATIHGLDRKTRLGPEIVADRRWEIRHVSRLLVVAATTTSRRRIARLATTYDVALPARGATVRNWLAQPVGPLAGLLFVADDSHGRTRRHAPGRERVRRPRSPESRAESRPNDTPADN